MNPFYVVDHISKHFHRIYNCCCVHVSVVQLNYVVCSLLIFSKQDVIAIAKLYYNDSTVI